MDIGRLALPTLPRTAPEKAEVIVEQYLARFSGRDFAVVQVTGWGEQQFSPQGARVESLVGTVLQSMATRGQLAESGGRYRRP